MCKKCSRCGEKLLDELDIRTVNPGTGVQDLICESCLSSLESNGRVIRCEACGELWSVDMLHDERLSDTLTFTACPGCHKDVVDGKTREEMLDEELLRYSVIVGFVEGRDRGYVVHADNRGEAIEKVLNILRQSFSGLCIASVIVSEVILKEDEIR